MQQQMQSENSSGMGKRADLPPGISGWSWGAFLLNWIWGIGNSVFIALLCLIPVVNIVMMVILGIKGREWAWRNRRWASVEDFRRVQKNWAIAGVILWAVLVVGVPTMLAYMFSGQKELALATIRQNPVALQILGEPLKTGWFVSGKVSTTPGGSCGMVSVPVSGSKASGRLRMASVGDGDKWMVLQALLIVDDQNIVVMDHPDLDRYLAIMKRCTD